MLKLFLDHRSFLNDPNEKQRCNSVKSCQLFINYRVIGTLCQHHFGTNCQEKIEHTCSIRAVTVRTNEPVFNVDMTFQVYIIDFVEKVFFDIVLKCTEIKLTGQ